MLKLAILAIGACAVCTPAPAAYGDPQPEP